ncbi:MAG: hypothetical protein IJ523_01695 [Succinivibrionaceae bacterium]|nr:hypothetical protein [Succinivibrionaceae bacterium]
MKRFNIAAMGELLFDVFEDGRRAPGGAPANFAYHSAMFGDRATLITALGEDERGRELETFCRARGLALAGGRSSKPTGCVMVRTSGGDISYEICENRAWDDLRLDDRAKEVLARSDVFAFGSLLARSEISRKALEEAFEILPQRCIRFCDINIRQHYFSGELAEFLLIRADILKLNTAELATVFSYADGFRPGMEQIRDHDQRMIADLAGKYSLRGVLLTDGEAGSLVLLDGSFSRIEAVRAEPGGDAVGAGDAFSAAFLTSLLHGMTPNEAHRFAACYASAICGRRGAWPEDADPSGLMKSVMASMNLECANFSSV